VRGWQWLIGVVLIGGMTAAGYLWFAPELAGRAEPVATAPGPKSVVVEVRPVEFAAVRREIDAVGSLRSNESVIVRPEIAGRITEILFKEGQTVRKGAPLFRLDAAIARAQVEQARASLALSRANFERVADLLRKGAATQRAYDEAVATLRADEAALALATATLEKTTLVAPFDGVLGLRKVSIGDYVTPGQDLVNIENIDSLKVDFRVPEIHALHLTAGQAIRVTLDAVPGESFQGQVYAIDPAIDPNGRAVILRAQIPNPDGRLRPGMFARVTLLLEERKDAIVVPETALVPIGEEQFVYRVVDEKAALTKVQLGQRRESRVEIVAGLPRDALIVVEGAMKLRDGTPVRRAKSASS
jgi:membrane fusion protein (multidrug efflux system)